MLSNQSLRRYLVQGVFAVPAIFLLSSFPARAQTLLDVNVRTGDDDLRRGNSAAISLGLRNGDVLDYVTFANGLRSNTPVSSRVRFERDVAPGDICNIRIKHDSHAPRGEPFGSQDEWDLKTLQIYALDATGRRIATLYNSEPAVLLTHFDSNVREITLPVCGCPR